MDRVPLDTPRREPDLARTNQWLLWIGLVAAVGWLVWRHGAHLGEVWPFLLLLACPLMHLWGHRHGSHHRSRAGEGRGRRHIDESKPGTTG